MSNTYTPIQRNPNQEEHKDDRVSSNGSNNIDPYVRASHLPVVSPRDKCQLQATHHSHNEPAEHNPPVRQHHSHAAVVLVYCASTIDTIPQTANMRKTPRRSCAPTRRYRKDNNHDTIRKTAKFTYTLTSQSSSDYEWDTPIVSPLTHRQTTQLTVKYITHTHK